MDNNTLIIIFVLIITVTGSPQVVCSANRNFPVEIINSTLELTSGGVLVRKDSDGAFAWSAETSDRVFLA